MWPKEITIKGVKLPVESIEEFVDIVKRLDNEGIDVISGGEKVEGKHKGTTGSCSLDATDKALLSLFYEGARRGLPNNHIAEVLGKRGKGMRPALEAWSRKIGLTSSGTVAAFEPMMRADGRGYRIKDSHMRVAKNILGM